MGAQTWDAWKEGKFDFSDLATRRHDDVYGNMLSRRPLKDLLPKNIDGKDNVYKLIDFPENMDEESKKIIGDAYIEIYRKNPDLAKAILNKVDYFDDLSAYAVAHGDGYIGINTKGFLNVEYDVRDVKASMRRWESSLNSLKAQYESTGDSSLLKQIKFVEHRMNFYEGIDEVKFAASSNPTDVMIHEMGHNIHDLLRKGTIDGIWEFEDAQIIREKLGADYQYEDTMYKKLWRWSQDKTTLRISEYATTNDREYFAECFTTWFRQMPETKYIPNQLIDIFERVMDGTVQQ